MLPYKVKSISELHQRRGLPKPAHPLISIIRIEMIKELPPETWQLMVTDFYMIALKKDFPANMKVKYGQQLYDHDDGLLTFMSPGQIFGIEIEEVVEFNPSGWVLIIHPDFLWNTSMAKRIRQYEFFDYAVNEALFLSEKEEMLLSQIIDNIEQELHANIDKYSQNIIISQLESLLNYAERFYGRQFITRQITNHGILERLEALLNNYFEGDEIIRNGLPSVSYIAEQLHVSADYLSGLLKTLTGMNTQQHIHQKLIEKAKEKLSTTSLTVSEIAYQLGFGHPQSFSKLFRTKTNLSPLAFRQTFN